MIRRENLNLDSHDHRRLLLACGFRINGQSGPTLSGVLGPPELGEGESGNFSVNLTDGLVKDWGSSGYQGDVFNVVMDVHGLDFPNALRWIVDELNLDVDTGGAPASSKNPAPLTSDEDELPDLAPEPVTSHENVGRWHTRLVGDTQPARAARGYLQDERGLPLNVLKSARIGLAHTPNDGRASWWVMIPVVERTNDERPVVAVKGFAFDPSTGDWLRREDRKMARNGGSASLYDVTPSDPYEGPVLVCEGELDALSAFSYGFNAVTGTAGASTFRESWARYVANLAPAEAHGVVICFDGDDTGREGSGKAAQHLHDAGLNVRIATLPDGLDVNDVLVNDGADALRSLVEAAEPYPAPPPEPADSSARDPAPASNGSTSYRPFPVDCLPGPVQAYVRAASKALPAPPAMVALPTLSVLAGAVGNRASIRLKRSWTEHATLWTVMVAPSGSTKSPAFSHAVRPVYRRESEARDAFERALKQWKASDEDETTKPTRRRYRTGDATPEAVVKILSDNPQGVLLSRDELGAWIGSFDRYVNGAADLQFWIEVWQGIQASRDRAGEGNTTVDHPVVPVTGTIQPGVLKRKLDELHFESGFASRLILCMPPPEPKRWTEADVHPDVRAGYERLLTGLYDAPESGERKLTPDAKALWIDFYDRTNADVETRPEGPAKAVAAKGISHAARLALILHRCRVACDETDGHEIDRESMEAALQVGQWLTRETLRVYDELSLDDEAVPPIRRFLVRLPDEFRTSEAKQIADEDDLPRSTFFDWLDKLQESGGLEKVKRGLYRKR